MTSIKSKLEKECRTCGTLFKLYKSTDVYCSNECVPSKSNVEGKKKPTRIRPVSVKRAAEKAEAKASRQGEMDLFIEIWNERPHFSELTGKPLLPMGNSKWHFQFLHVLNKGRFPKCRLDKENILLGLPDEHDHQDQFEVFRKQKVYMLRKMYL